MKKREKNKRALEGMRLGGLFFILKKYSFMACLGLHCVVTVNISRARFFQCSLRRKCLNFLRIDSRITRKRIVIHLSNRKQIFEWKLYCRLRWKNLLVNLSEKNICKKFNILVKNNFVQYWNFWRKYWKLNSTLILLYLVSRGNKF